MSRLNIPYQFQNLISNGAHTLYRSRWMPGRSVVNRSRTWALQQRMVFERLSDEEQDRLVLEQVRAQVAYCRRYVPYYRKVLSDFPPDFPYNLLEYRQLPILEKETIREAGESLLSEEYDKTQLTRHSTGGSTGQPVTVYLSWQEHGLGEAGNEIYMRSIGGGPGKRIATLYGGDLDVSARPGTFRLVKDWILNEVNYGCFRMDDPYLWAVHTRFTRFRPHILLGYASAVYLLACLLKKKNIRPIYPTGVILTAAEKLEDYQRTCIEDVFGAPVVERYGSREMGSRR